MGDFFSFPMSACAWKGIFVFALRSLNWWGTSPKIQQICRRTAVLSNVFQVYSPKSFPGMSESTFLTRCFADQGVRIRIRKETRSASLPGSTGKRRRHTTDDPNHEQQSKDDIPKPRIRYAYDPTLAMSRSRETDHRGLHTPEPTIPLPQPRRPTPYHAMSMENLLHDDGTIIHRTRTQSASSGDSASRFYPAMTPSPSLPLRPSPSYDVQLPPLGEAIGSPQPHVPLLRPITSSPSPPYHPAPNPNSVTTASTSETLPSVPSSRSRPPRFP
ncbi:velvet factor-domain-containing protein [Syncephalastrum racemosum]|uniref:Velvet factor-domain-containing protein n=1 Tax=Syncephalastrum racemosum TaxID=13706 RepID=A0A1X2HCR5_SYNRA|nr:velvet factor-domain-containing protein [Syncephalastrum racemosum]